MNSTPEATSRLLLHRLMRDCFRGYSIDRVSGGLPKLPTFVFNFPFRLHILSFFRQDVSLSLPPPYSPLLFVDNPPPLTLPLEKNVIQISLLSSVSTWAS